MNDSNQSTNNSINELNQLLSNQSINQLTGEKKMIKSIENDKVIQSHVHNRAVT